MLAAKLHILFCVGKTYFWKSMPFLKTHLFVLGEKHISSVVAPRFWFLPPCDCSPPSHPLPPTVTGVMGGIEKRPLMRELKNAL